MMGALLLLLLGGAPGPGPAPAPEAWTVVLRPAVVVAPGPPVPAVDEPAAREEGQETPGMAFLPYTLGRAIVVRPGRRASAPK